MGVSKNNGTPKSSFLIGFSMIFTIHFGIPLFLETSVWTFFSDLPAVPWVDSFLHHIDPLGWRKVKSGSEKFMEYFYIPRKKT